MPTWPGLSAGWWLPNGAPAAIALLPCRLFPIISIAGRWPSEIADWCAQHDGLIRAAASGHSGNDGRDKKMHKEVLESASYPDIVFRPDRVEGEVSDMAASTVQVHGMFSIHGAEHEITIPVRVKVSPGQWTATSHFTVPYVKWGLKNPSTFVLRVEQSVEIDIQVSGETP